MLSRARPALSTALPIVFINPFQKESPCLMGSLFCASSCAPVFINSIACGEAPDCVTPRSARGERYGPRRAFLARLRANSGVYSSTFLPTLTRLVASCNRRGSDIGCPRNIRSATILQRTEQCLQVLAMGNGDRFPVSRAARHHPFALLWAFPFPSVMGLHQMVRQQ